MSVVYSDHSTMNSPLNNNSPLYDQSPFGAGRNDLLNYSYDFTTNLQITNYEKSLIFKFLINHSFNYLITNYQNKLHASSMQNMCQFVLLLFKRTNLSLLQFQKLLIIMIRYLNKNQTIVLSIKQIIIGCLIKIMGVDSKNWSQITGLSLENLTLLKNHINLDHDEMIITEDELLELNDHMKSLVYSKFDVI